MVSSHVDGYHGTIARAPTIGPRDSNLLDINHISTDNNVASAHKARVFDIGSQPHAAVLTALLRSSPVGLD